MKILILLFSFLFFNSPSSPDAGNEIDSLDGISITYEYNELGTVRLDFYDGLIKYEWLEGNFAGLSSEGHSYQSKKLHKKSYLISWFEKERSSLITVFIDFSQNKIQTSALLNPGTENEMVLFHPAKIKEQTFSAK